MTHTILVEELPDGKWRHSNEGRSTIHAVDGLTRLCRQMVHAGLSGPARVVDAAGTHRFTVLDVVKMAKKTLVENDRGMGLRKFVEFDKGVFE